MKTLSCDMCEATFDAESFEEWFKQMMPHYMAEHADIMEASKNKTKEDGGKWMAAAKKRFEDA